MQFIWRASKKFFSFQFSHFLLIGCLNTFCDFLIVNILAFVFQVYQGINLLLINTFSFVTVVTMSFFLNKKWTFQKTSEDKQLVKRQYLLFFGITLVGLILNNTIVYFLTTILGPQFGLNRPFWLNFSKAMAVGVVLFWNFFNYKYLVFRPKA